MKSIKQHIIDLLKERPLSADELFTILSDRKPESILRRLYDLVDFGVAMKRDDKFCLVRDLNANDKDRTIEQLEKQIDYLIKRNRVTDYNYEGDVVRIGVISDTHLGSIHENLDLLNAAYETFRREGITRVFHAGDITDGEHMRPGHEYEIKIVGFDNQVKHVVERYPRVAGIETILLAGNHDYSFYKHSGADICYQIARFRDDIKYVGVLEADTHIRTKTGSVVVRLWHPLLGSAYSISYHPQKYVESLPGGAKPHILVVGNFHKAEWLLYRNVHIIQPGCIQYQTLWMRGKRISAQMGFAIVEFWTNKNGIARLRFEFFPDYNS